VRLVRIDATLGETMLKRWANACEQVGKPMFLRGTVTQKLKDKHSKLIRCLMRLIDAIAALLLLTLLSPVMLALVLIMYVYSPGWLFSFSWHVGARGKLFRAIKFRTTPANDDSLTTPLGRWMCKYHLDELPQLFNVLRGEMSLVRPYSLSLSKAVRLSLKTDTGARLDWSLLCADYPLMPE
jgi:lipopolysaccharide/colanic/teichoic acid biosynthesis glycosyltransferase